jgi:hypothetical protein
MCSSKWTKEQLTGTFGVRRLVAALGFQPRPLFYLHLKNIQQTRIPAQPEKESGNKFPHSKTVVADAIYQILTCHWLFGNNQ